MRYACTPILVGVAIIILINLTVYFYANYYY